MAKKAKYSRALGARVRRVGGASTYRSRLGYLPATYHQNPKKWASKLSEPQKKRVSRMHNISEASFKRIYGFKKRKVGK